MGLGRMEREVVLRRWMWTAEQPLPKGCPNVAVLCTISADHSRSFVNGMGSDNRSHSRYTLRRALSVVRHVSNRSHRP